MFDDLIMHHRVGFVRYRGDAVSFSIAGRPARVDPNDVLPPGLPFVLGRVRSDGVGLHAKLFFDDDDVCGWFRGRSVYLCMRVDEHLETLLVQLRAPRHSPARLEQCEGASLEPAVGDLGSGLPPPWVHFEDLRPDREYGLDALRAPQPAAALIRPSQSQFLYAADGCERRSVRAYNMSQSSAAVERAVSRERLQLRRPISSGSV